MIINGKTLQQDDSLISFDNNSQIIIECVALNLKYDSKIEIYNKNTGISLPLYLDFDNKIANSAVSVLTPGYAYKNSIKQIVCSTGNLTRLFELNFNGDSCLNNRCSPFNSKCKPDNYTNIGYFCECNTGFAGQFCNFGKIIINEIVFNFRIKIHIFND
jgi:hypothetical protein